MFTRSTLKWTATAACAMAPASLLLAALGSGHALLIGILMLATGAAGILLRRHLLREWDAILAEQHAEHLRFETAINNISQGLCFFDGQRRLIVCNNRYATMYGLTPELVRRGTTLAQILDHRFTTGAMPAIARDEYVAWRERIAAANEHSDTVVTLRDGRVFEIHHEPMPDGGWVATHADITEHRRVQAEIERLARSDALTSLPNRLHFRERLNEALAMASATAPVAVLCVDLDRFKAVNDTLGHPVGDELLHAAGQRLRQCIREGDLVARLGGDEFAIIQTGAPQPAAARATADRLIASIGAPFVLQGHSLQVGASVGVAIIDNATTGADDTLKRADLALYDAKAHGRGCVSLYQDNMVDQARERQAARSTRVALEGAPSSS
jgi:diguanylate cyclase (GGDEF)-like protein